MDSSSRPCSRSQLSEKRIGARCQPDAVGRGRPFRSASTLTISASACRAPSVLASDRPARRSVPRHSHLTTVLLTATVAAVVACGSGSPSQQVSFPTADGGTVGADFYPAKGPDAVVLAHGAAFDKASWAPLATWLAGRGHQVLAINFRGYGHSMAGGDSQALFEDVLGAVRYLHAHGVSRVAVLGASMGGGAAAEAVVRAAPGEI